VTHENVKKPASIFPMGQYWLSEGSNKLEMDQKCFQKVATGFLKYFQ